MSRKEVFSILSVFNITLDNKTVVQAIMAKDPSGFSYYNCAFDFRDPVWNSAAVK